MMTLVMMSPINLASLMQRQLVVKVTPLVKVIQAILAIPLASRMLNYYY